MKTKKVNFNKAISDEMKRRKNTAKLRALETANKAHRSFVGSITFEDFLRNNSTETDREFRLVVREINADSLTLLIHPAGRDGQTYDAYSIRYNLEPKQAIDNLMKFLRSEKVLTEGVPKTGSYMDFLVKQDERETKLMIESSNRIAHSHKPIE